MDESKTVLNGVFQKIQQNQDSLKSTFYTTLRDNHQLGIISASQSNGQMSINEIERLKSGLEPWRFCRPLKPMLALDYAIQSEYKDKLAEYESKNGPASEILGVKIFLPYTAKTDLIYFNTCIKLSNLNLIVSRIIELHNDMGIETRLPIFDWVTETPWRLRWWYLIFLFFVGLRLGKVTAEVTNSRVRGKNRASASV